MGVTFPPARTAAFQPLRRALCAPVIAVVLGLSPMSGTVAPALAAPAGPTLEPAGPLWALRRSRRLVRGDRPARRGAHTRWQPGTYDPEAGDRAALEAFERASMPHRKTRPLDGPPVGWMRSLRVGDLPIRWNDKTVRYLSYFRDTSRGRTLLRGWFTRLGRYEPVIRRILREHGVPEDLMMVALAESGFRSDVRSRVGAAGLWQFMESTARVYGLRVDFWVDERLDPIKSTHAAAAFLSDLYARFGSWELALAAYNAGYGVVMTAMARHNTNNYWSLAAIESGLPYATTQYVPKILAAAVVGRNRSAFGVGPGQIESLDPARWAEVEVPPGVALADLARIAQVDESLLAEINGHLLRGRTPPGARTRLRVPPAARSRLASAAGRVARLAQDVVRRPVRAGERLEAVARSAGISERTLRRLNGIRDAAEVTPGTVLFVPAPKPGARAKRPPQQQRPLAAVPPLALAPGERLVFFEVTRGTTPATVAALFGIPWEHIAAWNDLDPRATLPTGLLLQVPVAASFDPAAAGILVYEREEVEHVVRGSAEHLEAELRRRGLMRRGYRVRRRDTFAKIARRFHMSTGDLARVNGVRRDARLSPGDVIVVYVRPGETRGTIRAPDPASLYGPKERGDEGAAPPTPKGPSTPETASVPGRR